MANKMIEPVVLYGRSEFGWWESVSDGFYAFSMDEEESDSISHNRYAVILNHEIAVEIFPRFADEIYGRTCYYLDHGKRTVTREAAIDYLDRNHPDVAEWFLFHPELL